jgi:predicted nucleotidyltransferase
LVALCHKYQIRKLAFFGSVLRDDFNQDSDVDIVVEFEPEARIGFFELIEIEMDLSGLIGRRVDLNTYGSLSTSIHQQVREQEWVLYEGASS